MTSRVANFKCCCDAVHLVRVVQSAERRHFYSIRSAISPDGAVSAQADVTYNAGTHILSVVLTNLTPNQNSSGQSLTRFYFDVGYHFASNAGAFTLTGNSVTLTSSFARPSFHRRDAPNVTSGGRPLRPE